MTKCKIEEKRETSETKKAPQFSTLIFTSINILPIEFYNLSWWTIVTCDGGQIGNFATVVTTYVVYLNEEKFILVLVVNFEFQISLRRAFPFLTLIVEMVNNLIDAVLAGLVGLVEGFQFRYRGVTTIAITSKDSMITRASSVPIDIDLTGVVSVSLVPPILE